MKDTKTTLRQIGVITYAKGGTFTDPFVKSAIEDYCISFDRVQIAYLQDRAEVYIAE